MLWDKGLAFNVRTALTQTARDWSGNSQLLVDTLYVTLIEAKDSLLAMGYLSLRTRAGRHAIQTTVPTAAPFPAVCHLCRPSSPI
jgi:hypothetical protein